MEKLNMWISIFKPLFTLWGPGGTELIVILVIVLLCFGARRLQDLARGMGESIRVFKTGVSREPRHQSSDSRVWWFLVLAFAAVVIMLSVLNLDTFSDKQKLALTVTLLAWIGVGYWSFMRKGDDL
jgi:sec-independent protein translocase protein TatA